MSKSDIIKAVILFGLSLIAMVMSVLIKNPIWLIIPVTYVLGFFGGVYIALSWSTYMLSKIRREE